MAGGRKFSGAVTVKDPDTGEEVTVEEKDFSAGKIGAHVIAEIDGIDTTGGSLDVNIVGDEVGIGGGGGGSGCGRLSDEYDVEFDDSELTLNALAGAYKTVYSYTGTGGFISTSVKFNSYKVLVKLTIDSKVIFEIDLEDFKKFAGNAHQGSNMCYLYYTNKMIHFCPKCPIEFGTDVEIEAKANYSSSSRKMTGYVVHIEKDS